MLRSLNARWDAQGFHERVSELVGPSPGEAILDLGCGRGSTLPHLLRGVGLQGKIVALDRNAGFLRTVASQHASEIAAARLEIVTHDLADRLPFARSTFDAVVCQNVLECVADRVALVEQAKLCVKPGGRILFGHHDFDAVVLASEDRAMTRLLIHGFADCIAEWQDAADGQMGRLLPGLVAGSCFREVVTETVLFVDVELTPGSYARGYLDWVLEKASAFQIDPIDAQRWLSDLENRAARGAFYFAIPWTYVIAWP